MNKVVIRAERCKGCGLCADACNKGLITLSKNTLNEKGYTPAEMGDTSLCTGCGACYRICPDCAISIWRIEKTPAS